MRSLLSFAIFSVIVVGALQINAPKPLLQTEQLKLLVDNPPPLWSQISRNFASANGPVNAPTSYEERIAYFEKVLQDTFPQIGLPGLTYGLVMLNTTSRVVLAQKTGALGVTNLDSKTPMNTATLFNTASTTKAFTAASVGMLVDEGLIPSFDTTITSLLPDFATIDAFVTNRMTLKDCLCHRTGYPDHGYDSSYMLGFKGTDADLLYRMGRQLPNNQDLRNVYQYSNMMYALAGYTAGVVGRSYSTPSGLPYSTWSDFAQARIFNPLGMTSTSTHFDTAKASGNWALGYDIEGHPVDERLHKCLEPVAPAGAIWSNVEDYIKWIKLQLGQGVSESGQRLISAASMRAMHTSIIPAPETFCAMPAPAMTFCILGYGMGWQQWNLNGRAISEHSGASLGHSTEVILFPNDGFGIVLMANRYGMGTPLLQLAVSAASIIFGDVPLPAASTQQNRLPLLAYPGLQDYPSQSRVGEPDERGCESADRPPLRASDMSLYAGEYVNGFFGKYIVRWNGTALTVEVDGVTTGGWLEHCFDDSFLMYLGVNYNGRGYPGSLVGFHWGLLQDSRMGYESFVMLYAPQDILFTREGKYRDRLPTQGQYTPSTGACAVGGAAVDPSSMSSWGFPSTMAVCIGFSCIWGSILLINVVLRTRALQRSIDAHLGGGTTQMVNPIKGQV